MSNYQNLRNELTDNNEHGASLMIDAIELSRFDIVKLLCDLQITHEEQGFLTKEQQDYRDNELAGRLLSGL